jgi:NAD-dependent deacetylase
MNDLEKFKAVLSESKKIVGFTGAGISTESGIPDYRSQGGIWEKFQPVYLDEFISNESKRLLYWQRKKALWQGIKDAKLSKTHVFFKELFDTGKLRGLITQNIDGLHEKSGLPKEVLVNLHGTNLEVICLDCGDIIPAHEILDDLNLDNGTPLCAGCGGLLKPNTISFGQGLIPEDMQRAELLALSCDLMIAAGSTLVVQPAASYPLIAKNNGAVLAIITQSDTPLDNDADFVFHEKLAEFLDKIMPVSA